MARAVAPWLVLIGCSLQATGVPLRTDSFKDPSSLATGVPLQTDSFEDPSNPADLHVNGTLSAPVRTQTSTKARVPGPLLSRMAEHPATSPNSTSKVNLITASSFGNSDYGDLSSDGGFDQTDGWGATHGQWDGTCKCDYYTPCSSNHFPFIGRLQSIEGQLRGEHKSTSGSKEYCHHYHPPGPPALVTTYTRMLPGYLSSSSSMHKKDELLLATKQPPFINKITFVIRDWSTTWSEIKGMRVFYTRHDASRARSVYHGTVPEMYKDVPGYSTATCEIGPGDPIDGDIRVAPDNTNFGVGAIEFMTKSGRLCSVGRSTKMAHTFPANNRLLTRIAVSVNGQGDTYNIRALHFFAFKEVSSIEAIDATSVGTSDQTKLIPEVVSSRTYCNEDSVERTFGESRQESVVETGEEDCLTSSSSYMHGTSFGMSATSTTTISGGFLVEAELSIEITAGFENSKSTTRSHDQESCASKTKMRADDVTFPEVTLPPGTATTYTVTRFKAFVKSQKYLMTMRLHFVDGSTPHNVTNLPYEFSGTRFGTSAAEFTAQIRLSSCSPATHQAGVQAAVSARHTQLLAMGHDVRLTPRGVAIAKKNKTSHDAKPKSGSTLLSASMSSTTSDADDDDADTNEWLETACKVTASDVTQSASSAWCRAWEQNGGTSSSCGPGWDDIKYSTPQLNARLVFEEAISGSWGWPWYEALASGRQCGPHKSSWSGGHGALAKTQPRYVWDEYAPSAFDGWHQQDYPQAPKSNLQPRPEDMFPYPIEDIGKPDTDVDFQSPVIRRIDFFTSHASDSTEDYRKIQGLTVYFQGTTYQTTTMGITSLDPDLVTSCELAPGDLLAGTLEMAQSSVGHFVYIRFETRGGTVCEPYTTRPESSGESPVIHELKRERRQNSRNGFGLFSGRAFSRKRYRVVVHDRESYFNKLAEKEETRDERIKLRQSAKWGVREFTSFDVDGRLLASAFAVIEYHDNQGFIYMLGFTFWKRLQSITMAPSQNCVTGSSVNAANCFAGTGTGAPPAIQSQHTHTFCNDNVVERDFGVFTMEVEMTTGSEQCISDETSVETGTSLDLSVSVTASVSVGTPFVSAEQSLTMETSISSETEYTNSNGQSRCESKENTKLHAFEIPAAIIQPHTSTQYTMYKMEYRAPAAVRNMDVTYTFEDKEITAPKVFRNVPMTFNERLDFGTMTVFHNPTVVEGSCDTSQNAALSVAPTKKCCDPTNADIYVVKADQGAGCMGLLSNDDVLLVGGTQTEEQETAQMNLNFASRDVPIFELESFHSTTNFNQVFRGSDGGAAGWDQVTKRNIKTVAMEGDDMYIGTSSPPQDQEVKGRLHKFSLDGQGSSAKAWHQVVADFSDSVTGLDFDRFGNMYVLLGNGQIHKVDRLTAKSAYVASVPGGASKFFFDTKDGTTDLVWVLNYNRLRLINIESGWKQVMMLENKIGTANSIGQFVSFDMDSTGTLYAAMNNGKIYMKKRPQGAHAAWGEWTQIAGGGNSDEISEAGEKSLDAKMSGITDILITNNDIMYISEQSRILKMDLKAVV